MESLKNVWQKGKQHWVYQDNYVKIEVRLLICEYRHL